MRSLRFLVACMLLLAIPLQGMAAAAMLYCGVQPQAAVEAGDSHGHGPDMTAHGHGADADHHAPAKVGDGDCDHDCSVCAASCHGAVASQAPQVVAFSVPGYVPQSRPAVVLRVRALPPPDKPPRA